MRVKLLVHNAVTRPNELVLHQFPLVIGRGAESDILLEDRWVSRRHCQIEERDGLLVVRDLGSRHGTLVNNAPVAESPLLPGDTLRVGLSTLVADYDAQANTAVTARLHA